MAQERPLDLSSSRKGPGRLGLDNLWVRAAFSLPFNPMEVGLLPPLPRRSLGSGPACA